jgi:hypothetical protein
VLFSYEFEKFASVSNAPAKKQLFQLLSENVKCLLAHNIVAQFEERINYLNFCKSFTFE